jgi:hypothetical protein
MYKTGAVCAATGVSAAKLGRWQDRKTLKQSRQDKASTGSGDHRLYSRETINKIAIAKKLTDLGIGATPANNAALLGGVSSLEIEGVDRPIGKLLHRQNGDIYVLMARPRTPTSVLKLRGAFKNHPSRGRDRENEPIISTALPAPPRYLESATAAMWLAIRSRGYWLTSADRFLVEIAAALMARYRIDELKSGDVSMLITLLGKIGFSPNERGKMDLQSDRA